jgi:hypothetical protein
MKTFLFQNNQVELLPKFYYLLLVKGSAKQGPSFRVPLMRDAAPVSETLRIISIAETMGDVI